MKERYRMFARYNACCNERLYEAASKVPDVDYRADRGAFFKSLHGALNDLLVDDRIRMKRFTGAGEQPPGLNAILYDNFQALREARRSQDVLITSISPVSITRGSTARCATARWSNRRPSSNRWRRRSTISSTSVPRCSSI